MRVLIAFAAIVLMTASAAGQTADQRLNGNLSGRNARATFNLQLEAGQIVTLTTSSPQNLDTILALNAPGGRQVAQNDDQESGVLSSRIVYVVRASGVHTAVVTGYGGATGPFELRVSYGLDVGLSDSARVLREETLSFDRRTPEIRQTVQLNADDIFVASTFALSEGLDTTLTLLDRSGAILAQSDDIAEGNFNSQIIFQAAETGSYQIVASTYGRNGVGNFVLSLATDPNAVAPLDFASIDGTVIARHEGELNDATPSREFRVDLAAGQTLLAVADTTSGDLDPVLRLTGPDGHPVAMNDDRGDGSLNAALAYTAARAGAYTLEFFRFRQAPNSGGYRLVLSSVAPEVVDRLQAMMDNGVTLSGPEQVIETTDFRVFYTLEGMDASTPEYSRAVADTLQEVLDAQRRIGWAVPVRDPDGRYRAFVADARGSMGYTKPVQIVFDNPNTADVRETGAARTVFVVDNDFLNMGKKAPPLSLMRATATHEFNHVVQYGYDGEEGLRWLYESTASWTETNTVGQDQDASDYVETDYASPQLCWTTAERGYDYAQWTLLQSLADVHGDRIVVRIWENSVRYDGFETMSRTLAEVNTTIPDMVQRWRAQNFARDYDLAPRFTRTVALGGAINRNGSFSPRGRIQQLGANYIALRLSGPRAFTLRGNANLELVGLGRRNGQIEVVPLGRGGVFDASQYQYAALMVFHREVPATPGACSDFDYSITTAEANGAAPAPAYQFSARHFAVPAN